MVLPKLKQQIRYYELGISLPQQEQTTKPKEQDMLTKEFIKSKEGFREKAYQDEGGKWTIGYGFTSIDGVPVKEGDTITKEDAEFQMDRILAQHQSYKSKITRPLTPYQEDALSSFEFNLGSGVWNQPRGKKIIEAINDGDFNTAAELWRTYNKVKNPKTGKYEESRGLVNRREQEANMLVATGD
jgi:lysozyme